MLCIAKNAKSFFIILLLQKNQIYHLPISMYVTLDLVLFVHLSIPIASSNLVCDDLIRNTNMSWPLATYRVPNCPNDFYNTFAPLKMNRRDSRQIRNTFLKMPLFVHPPVRFLVRNDQPKILQKKKIKITQKQNCLIITM